MTLLGLLVLLLLVGLVLKFFPVDPPIKQLIYAIIVLIVVLVALAMFGIIPNPSFR